MLKGGELPNDNETNSEDESNDNYFDHYVDKDVVKDVNGESNTNAIIETSQHTCSNIVLSLMASNVDFASIAFDYDSNDLKLDNGLDLDESVVSISCL